MAIALAAMAWTPGARLIAGRLNLHPLANFALMFCSPERHFRLVVGHETRRAFVGSAPVGDRGVSPPARCSAQSGCHALVVGNRESNACAPRRRALSGRSLGRRHDGLVRRERGRGVSIVGDRCERRPGTLCSVDLLRRGVRLMTWSWSRGDGAGGTRSLPWRWRSGPLCPRSLVPRQCHHSTPCRMDLGSVR